MQRFIEMSKPKLKYNTKAKNVEVRSLERPVHDRQCSNSVFSIQVCFYCAVCVSHSQSDDQNLTQFHTSMDKLNPQTMAEAPSYVIDGCRTAILRLFETK